MPAQHDTVYNAICTSSSKSILITYRCPERLCSYIKSYGMCCFPYCQITAISRVLYLILCDVCNLILRTLYHCQAQLRPVAMLFPDCGPVLEVWLVCCGFTEAKPLAMKIKTFFKLISEQVTEKS